MSTDFLLFIDANKYLDLYRTDHGKEQLAPLSEQAQHIFITQQVVNEVLRNKIKAVADYLKGKSIASNVTFSVPNLSGPESDKHIGLQESFGEISDRLKAAAKTADLLFSSILDDVSKSKDNITLGLAPIFERAIRPTEDEVSRARLRKEFGNPPGKTADCLGDQISWEQILSHFKSRRKLWIVSRDGDYGTKFNKNVYANQLLRAELLAINPDSEIYLFENIPDALRHFVANTGVEAKAQLSPETAEAVIEEEEVLPSLDSDLGRLAGLSFGPNLNERVNAWAWSQAFDKEVARIKAMERLGDRSLFEKEAERIKAMERLADRSLFEKEAERIKAMERLADRSLIEKEAERIKDLERLTGRSLIEKEAERIKNLERLTGRSLVEKEAERMMAMERLAQSTFEKEAERIKSLDRMSSQSSNDQDSKRLEEPEAE